ncbi:MAG: carbohydrate ABC transporter permease [Chitinophagales bacterium]
MGKRLLGAKPPVQYYVLIFGALLALVFITPLILTVTNSFMSLGEIMSNYGMIIPDQDSNEMVNNGYANLKLVPDMVTIRQYYQVLIKESQYLFMFWNSVFLVAMILIGQILVASTAAFAFAKIDFRWKEPLFLIYILVMLMPFQVTLVPNYLVADFLGLIDKPGSIILPGIFSAFGVFLLRQFMSSIPDQYIEAARIDGAGYFTIFYRIILPMSKNAIAALAILVFMDNWNMVEQPLIFLQSVFKQPLSLFLSQVNLKEMGIAFAASTIYMIPALLVFFYAENYFVEGIQHSGLKL